MDTLIVYSSDTCPNCDQLKKALGIKGIEFKEVNIHREPERVHEIHEKGFRQLPVMNNSGDWMSGFTRQNFQRVIDSHAAAN